MRIETIKIYKFYELNDQSKNIAIEQIKNQYYQFNNFNKWATDDCYLFQPIDLETDFKEFSSKLLIQNTKEKIYFNEGNNKYLDCTKAMKITHKLNFFKWLGIPYTCWRTIEYKIATLHNSNNTQIVFTNYKSNYESEIKLSIEKFNQHIQIILKKLSSSVDYKFTDEAIIEDILANDYEFLFNGKQY